MDEEIEWLNNRIQQLLNIMDDATNQNRQLRRLDNRLELQRLQTYRMLVELLKRGEADRVASILTDLADYTESQQKKRMSEE
jgi:DNA-binding GntR family transcriptional regulator